MPAEKWNRKHSDGMRERERERHELGMGDGKGKHETYTHTSTARMREINKTPCFILFTSIILFESSCSIAHIMSVHFKFNSR